MNTLSTIIDNALSHISSQSAKIAKAELMREIAQHYSHKLKELNHFKDSNVGLYALDSLPTDLLSDFWNSKSDQCPLECEESDEQVLAFREFAKKKFHRIGKGEIINDDQHANIIIADEGFDVFEIPMFGGEPVFVKNVGTLEDARDLVDSCT